MSVNKLDEDLRSKTVERSWQEWKWWKPKPHLNYKTSSMCSMPPRINPKNWESITAEDLKAHQERQALRGRLRREYWTKAYHPENYKYFTVHSEKAFVRFGWLKTVWHMKDTVQATGAEPLKALLGMAVITATFFYFGFKYAPERRSIVDRLKENGL